MKSLFQSVALCTLFVMLGILAMPAFSFAQLGEIENKIPKNAPIKVEFRNHDSTEWFYDLEVEVTNTGTKPIYLLFLSLDFDTRDENGVQHGNPFFFGNGDLYSTENVAGPDDPYISPNGKHIFKVSEGTAKAWAMRKQSGFAVPTAASVRLGWINFGDGTGLKARGKPFKKKL